MTVPDEGTEKLVAIIELKKRGGTRQDAMDELAVLKREVTSANSMSRGLSVADLVLVPAGSFPITTSGKVPTIGVGEQYRQDQLRFRPAVAQWNVGFFALS